MLAGRRTQPREVGVAWCCEPARNRTRVSAGTVECCAPRGSTHRKLFGERTPRSVVAEREAAMEVVYERCCGLDVHKQRVVACVVVSAGAGPPAKEVRTFGTMTGELLRLAAWLTEQG